MRARPERVLRGIAGATPWVLALLLLGWSVGARAAAMKTVSPAQFRADVARLQGMVGACEGAATACDAAQVGDDERVGNADQGGFAMHWQWLRDALNEAKTAKDRTAALREAAARLNELAQESGPGAEPSQPGFDRARAAANAVLARAEFQAVVGPTWWDRLKAKLWGWLAQIFAGVDRLGSAAPWIGKLLEWLLFTGAAVGLLIFLLRQAARQRLRVAMGAGAVKATAWDRESTDWARLAEGHAAAGEWRDAVHCLYWAAIVLLEARRTWRHNPTRTPREYVRLLASGSARQRALRALTQIFERVWYGLREADGAEYARARELYGELAAGAEDGSNGAGREPAAAGVA